MFGQPDFTIPSSRKPFCSVVAIAATAVNPYLLTFDCPIGSIAQLSARVAISAGVDGPGVALDSAVAGTDVITATAHGFTTRQAVRHDTAGGPGLGGLTTGNTTYFVRVLSADTFSLYDSADHASAGGATGLIDITNTGSGLASPVFYPKRQIYNALITAFFKTQLDGSTKLIGTPDVVGFNDAGATVPWTANAEVHSSGSGFVIRMTAKQATYADAEALVTGHVDYDR